MAIVEFNEKFQFPQVAKFGRSEVQIIKTLKSIKTLQHTCDLPTSHKLRNTVLFDLFSRCKVQKAEHVEAKGFVTQYSVSRMSQNTSKLKCHYVQEYQSAVRVCNFPWLINRRQSIIRYCFLTFTCESTYQSLFILALIVYVGLRKQLTLI